MGLFNNQNGDKPALVCHAVLIPFKKLLQMVKSQVSWTQTHEDLLCTQRSNH